MFERNQWKIGAQLDHCAPDFGSIARGAAAFRPPTVLPANSWRSGHDPAEWRLWGFCSRCSAFVMCGDLPADFAPEHQHAAKLQQRTEEQALRDLDAADLSSGGSKSVKLIIWASGALRNGVGGDCEFALSNDRVRAPAVLNTIAGRDRSTRNCARFHRWPLLLFICCRTERQLPIFSAALATLHTVRY